MRLHRVKLDTRELLQQLFTAYRTPTQEKRINTTPEIALPIDIQRIRSDRERLSQVLHNPLSNPMRHSREHGKIKVAIRLATADTRLTTATRVAVSSRTAGGVGLGLTITKGTVEAHGGYVWRGNTFVDTGSQRD